MVRASASPGPRIMAETAEQIGLKLIAIKSARDTGVLIVRHGDTSTQFRSLEEMNSIIAILEGQLNEANGTPKRPRVRYVKQSTKGF